MPKAALDIDGLHYVLWLQADDRDAVRVVQIRLAEELSVSKFVLNRAMQQLEREDRIETISTSKSGKLYLVADPATFRGEPDGQP